MGVYLSTPNVELEAEDGQSSRLKFGAASMQGWRVGQEDAHIAVVDYGDDTSLFGVFDGHGGQEVAKYCAQHLPDFIKSLHSYQTNSLNDCLEEAFLKFDQTLTQQEVIDELKILSGNPEMDTEDNDVDDEINEAILLREEADLPIADLMARYNHTHEEPDKGEADPECSSSSNSKRRFGLPSHMRSEMVSEKSKPLSPFLRAKRNVNRTEEPAEQCSSSSGTVLSGQTSEVSPGVDPGVDSESRPDSTNQMDSEANESITKSDETKVSNDSKAPTVSNGELNADSESTDCQPTSSIADGLSAEVNENNCETNSEITSDNTSGDQPSSPLPYKGKGKHKKIMAPKTVSPSSTTDAPEETAKPIYKYFLEDFDESDDSEESEDDFEGNDDSSDEEEDDEDVSDEESEEEEDEPTPTTPCYEKPGFDSGCTAVVALLKGNHLVVANAGDSRCVVSRNGKAVEMSVDHKPEDEIERNRVERAGGKVTPDGRVNGGLNLSRAIGDHAYKRNRKVSDREQMITALPDVKTLVLEAPDDQFMVIACDGIWNSMTSQQVVDFVGQRLEKADKLSTICDELFRTCLAPNTHGDGTGCDNMTCVIVKFANLTNKRKLNDDNGVVNDLETDVKPVSTEEPKSKRIKTSDNCESEGQLAEAEATTV